ncbi:uncharacterized protein ARMOST_12729 [Armillaria ostoyae]|uniref:Uncharacterized protein n=1 Tax=Armillaria ostoyae TaxID=47428 RepID=A0A284RKT4_ARMOS|nr:uncharacterized protein ARMOST_12729 [Armillaria ostoyae]
MASALFVSSPAFRTRVSIVLEQTKAQLSVLPVDWSIVVDDAPDGEETDLVALRGSWAPILAEITLGMVPQTLRRYGLDIFNIHEAIESRAQIDNMTLTQERPYY